MPKRKRTVRTLEGIMKRLAEARDERLRCAQKHLIEGALIQKRKEAVIAKLEKELKDIDEFHARLLVLAKEYGIDRLVNRVLQEHDSFKINVYTEYDDPDEVFFEVEVGHHPGDLHYRSYSCYSLADILKFLKDRL